MLGRAPEYEFKTSLIWTNKKKGILKSTGKPDIIVSCPPEFGGHIGNWSPEDLFLASVEVCIMTSFLHFIFNHNISLKSYESNARGIIALEKGVFRFKEIIINVNITVETEIEKNKIERIKDKISKICLISNSINSYIELNINTKVG